MAGYEVEFVGAEPPLEPSPRPPQAARRPSLRAADVRRLAVPVLWFGAAALCLLASAQTTFTYRFTGHVITAKGGYDAWGHALDTRLLGEHGPRYAIPLIGCAALCAALGSILITHNPRGRTVLWGLRSANLLGVAAAGFLAGTLVALVLTIQSSFASYRAVARSLQVGGVKVAVGPCLWFGLGGLVCAVGALVVSAVLAGRRGVAAPAMTRPALAAATPDTPGPAPTTSHA